MEIEMEKPTSRHIDISGQRFGRLVAIEFAGRAKNRRSLWRCRCDCGEERIFNSGNLRAGRSNSCGCLQRELTTSRSTKHGFSGTPEYNCWCKMISRCTNPNNKAFHHYGARGIAVCNRWRHDFDAFLADMGKRPEGMTLDRLDNNGNYEPSNCRWATNKEQGRNKRNTIFVEVGGKKVSLAEACEGAKISLSSAYARILRGASFAGVLSAFDRPHCSYCCSQEGLRQSNDGGGYEAPDFVCEGCFTPTDTGPSFDDLPEADPTL